MSDTTSGGAGGVPLWEGQGVWLLVPSDAYRLVPIPFTDGKAFIWERDAQDGRGWQETQVATRHEVHLAREIARLRAALDERTREVERLRGERVAALIYRSSFDGPASRLETALKAIVAEIDRATAKFPTWPTDPLHALAVLGEEFGELTKATVQGTYEPHKNAPDELRKEAIQTAAMALRFVMSLDTYKPSPGEQHRQAALAASGRGETTP